VRPDVRGAVQQLALRVGGKFGKSVSLPVSLADRIETDVPPVPTSGVGPPYSTLRDSSRLKLGQLYSRWRQPAQEPPSSVQNGS
jgi:hypothetical protein